MEETLNSIMEIANKKIFRYHSIASIERVLLAISIFGTALSRLMINRVIFLLIGIALMFLDTFCSKVIHTFRRIRDSVLIIEEDPELQEVSYISAMLTILNRSSIFTIIVGVFMKDNGIKTRTVEQVTADLSDIKYKLKTQSIIISILLILDLILLIQPMIYSDYFYLIRFGLTVVLFTIVRFSVCDYLINYISINKVLVPTSSETNK